MDFAAVAPPIQAFLAERDAPVALVGALALQCHGVARATADLDLLTVQSVREELVAFLEACGYETLHVSTGYSNHLAKGEGKQRVDIVYVDAATARQLFAGAVTRDALPGLEIAVPRAEHLIAMKVRAMSNDPSRRFQDLADVQALMRTTDLDRAEVRAYFEREELGTLYDQIEESL
ncbi:MAG TPA: nucleotidyl transferase AbiEii/AbiGii toxin family protein [Thermoanaerobaculia bacterium]|nr:nucleotidyl transferase AbiEii/AbiGii toxin family protein [Thermoanaerobaculia bacterium]